jgi:hypothetical protein
MGAYTKKQEQLRAAGIEQAASCVMIADKTSTKLVDGHFVDNAILRRFLSVQKSLVDQVGPCGGGGGGAALVVGGCGRWGW